MRIGRKLRKQFFYPAAALLILIILPACQPQGSLHSVDLVEETDYGCAYFYFLWGRQAELAMQYEEALEAYEKALICDPGADYIVRKIPVLLMRMDRGEEAAALLEKYLQDNPLDSGARVLLARVYISLGKYSSAAGQYREIHDRDPKEVSSLLLLSELYLNRNMLGDAEQTLKEVLTVRPDSYPALVLLARIHLNNKDYESALEEYRKALDLNWSVDLLMEMSEVYVEQEDYGRVIAIYREILEQDAGNERVSFALINFLLLQKKEKEALAELNRLKTMTEKPGREDLTIARFYARLGEYDRSIAILREFLERENSPDARYLLGVILAQAEKYEQAVSELQMVDSDAEEYGSAVILRVRILRFLDRPEQAVEVLEKAVQHEQSRSPDMYVLLAALYQLQNKSDLGRKTFDRALSAFPGNDELLYDYGLFLDTLGSQEEALSVMQELIRRQPEHGEALNYVGYLWADKSIHLDKALEYIQRAVRLKPDNNYILDSLGWVYYRLGRMEEARQTLEEAVRISSEDEPTILEHLGDVYLELGRVQDALATYTRALVLLDENSEAARALSGKIRLLESQEKQP